MSPIDAPVDFAPRAQIEDAERRLYELAESGRYDGGFQRFAQALTIAVDMAAKAFQRDGKLSGIATGMRDLDIKMGGLQALRSDHRRRPPRHGQDRARHQHRLQCGQGASRRGPGRRHHEVRSMAALSVSSPAKCRPSSSPPVFSPSRPASPRARSAAAALPRSDFEKIRDYSIELQSLPLYVDETGGLSISQLTARARRLKRQKGLDLIVVDYIQLLQGSGKKGNPTTASRKSPRSPPA